MLPCRQSKELVHGSRKSQITHTQTCTKFTSNHNSQLLMLYGRLVHVGETFNGFQAVNYTKMRLAAGLCPDPLGGGELQRSPRPPSRYKGEDREGREGMGWE